MEVEVSQETKEAREALKKLETREGLIDLCLGAGADEDYNPSAPNDFEKIMGRRVRIRKEMEERIQRDKILRDHIEMMKKAQLEEPAFINEMDLTAEEAYQARLKRSRMNQEQPGQTEASKADSKIKKMMESMGWKGKGLGK